MNIDFLKVGKHSKTEDYLDMLYSSNLLPVHNKTYKDHKPYHNSYG